MIDKITKIALLAILTDKLTREEIFAVYEILEVPKDETAILVKQYNDFLKCEHGDLSENLLSDMKGLFSKIHRNIDHF